VPVFLHFRLQADFCFKTVFWRVAGHARPILHSKR
jgi:hypothetical protein